MFLKQIRISELDEGNGCRHITRFPANIPNKSIFKQFLSDWTKWNVNRKLLFCLNKRCSFCRFAWYWDWRNHINKHWFPSWTSFIFPSVFDIVEASFLMFAGWYIGPDVHLRRSSWAFHPGPSLGIDGWWTHGRGLPRWASTRVRVTRKRRQVTWRMGWSSEIFGNNVLEFSNCFDFLWEICLIWKNYGDVIGKKWWFNWTSTFLKTCILLSSGDWGER